MESKNIFLIVLVLVVGIALLAAVFSSFIFPKSNASASESGLIVWNVPENPDKTSTVEVYANISYDCFNEIESKYRVNNGDWQPLWSGTWTDPKCQTVLKDFLITGMPNAAILGPFSNGDEIEYSVTVFRNTIKLSTETKSFVVGGQNNIMIGIIGAAVIISFVGLVIFWSKKQSTLLIFLSFMALFFILTKPANASQCVSTYNCINPTACTGSYDDAATRGCYYGSPKTCEFSHCCYPSKCTYAARTCSNTCTVSIGTCVSTGCITSPFYCGFDQICSSGNCATGQCGTDGWYDVTSWYTCSDNSCQECKDQKYRDYGCSSGSCIYSTRKDPITGQDVIQTIRQNKANGIACGTNYCDGNIRKFSGACSSGSCVYSSSDCGTTSYCSSSTASCSSCASGTANCDKLPSNGCEINLNTNANNCGSCGHACSGGQVCQSGTCVTPCSNECSPSGSTQSQCSGNTIQTRTCGNYDADTCLEWSSWTNGANCDSSDTTCKDYYCSSGSCKSNNVASGISCGTSCNPSCTNKCCTKTCDGSGNCQSCTYSSCSQCDLNQCGPCDNCGLVSGLNCGYCQKCTVNALGVWACAPCDIRVGQDCSSSISGCSGTWKCESVNGICQLPTSYEQCYKAVDYQKGYCSQNYQDVKGECISDSTAANLVNQVTWAKKITDLGSQYSCPAGQILWCYNLEDCQNVCGGRDGKCGSAGSIGATSICKFDTSTLRCTFITCGYSTIPQLNIEYHWNNVQSAQADVYVKLTNPDPTNCCFHGNVKVELRKTLSFPNGCGALLNGDQYCDLAGNCDCTQKYALIQSIAIGSPTEATVTATFKSQTQGQYHFDVWYENTKSGSQTADVTLTGGGTTTTTTLPSSSRCGESCGTVKCSNCQVCNSASVTCVPAENLGLNCNCDTCYDSVAPNTGGCACKGGQCVENFAEVCAEQGFRGEGCSCRPRSTGFVYLGEDGCLQTGCLPIVSWYPREAFCSVYSEEIGRCGMKCGDKTCDAASICGTRQLGTDTDTYNFETTCTPTPSCTINTCVGKDDMTPCTVDSQSGVCCSQDCKINGNCCSNDDCLSKSGRKGTCDITGTYTTPYTCWWDPCIGNPDCDAGYCCEKAAYAGATITINPPFGCVQQKTIKDNNYLCDPPEWDSVGEKSNYLSFILKLILNAFNLI